MDRFLARAFSSAAAQVSCQDNEHISMGKPPRREAGGPATCASCDDSNVPAIDNNACPLPHPIPLDGTAAILDAWEKKEYFKWVGGWELNLGLTWDFH